eukprot:SAG11_NODE_6993_length_1211_cov_0.686433_3_plen_113_part_00
MVDLSLTWYKGTRVQTPGVESSKVVLCAVNSEPKVFELFKTNDLCAVLTELKAAAVKASLDAESQMAAQLHVGAVRLYPHPAGLYLLQLTRAKIYCAGNFPLQRNQREGKTL